MIGRFTQNLLGGADPYFSWVANSVKNFGEHTNMSNGTFDAAPACYKIIHSGTGKSKTFSTPITAQNISAAAREFGLVRVCAYKLGTTVQVKPEDIGTAGLAYDIEIREVNLAKLPPHTVHMIDESRAALLFEDGKIQIVMVAA